MTRFGLWTVGLTAVALAMLLALPVLMFMAILGSGGEDEAGCGPSGGPPSVKLVAASTASSLSTAQLENAATIIAVGSQMRMPVRGIVVALAVASQESGFRNYANDGLGGDLHVTQMGIAASLDLPHEAVGTDHGSLGIFQQQWPWWGTMQELMNPATAAETFYTALLEVPGWETLPVTSAGQAVQRSAFPLAYADDKVLAERLLSDPALVDADITTTSSFESGACVPGGVAPGTVVHPLGGGATYVDQANWGGTGSHWARNHTGTDFSAACGTPVRAATNGIVVVRTDQPWSGRWLVQVSTGVGRLTTWYAHMRSLAVSPGESVVAGQVIGEVGSVGNSTGCHLHFEVHPRGGSIYEDDVDPTRWLADNLGRTLDGGDVVPAGLGSRSDDGMRPAGSGEFVLATLNVLGASHTRRGGNKPWFADSTVRMRWAVDLLDRNAVDVVGLQEFQKPQRADFLRFGGDRYDVFSPPGDPQDSIAWRRDRFELVGSDTFRIPYFVNERRMPVVRLRDRGSRYEVIVVSVHNPASIRRHGNQAPHRAEAVRRELRVVEGLSERYRVPVVLVGDFNEREVAFCRLTRTGLLESAAGGASSPVCEPPLDMRIDQIFASGGLDFEAYRALRGRLLARATDHPLVLARASWE